MTRGTVLSALVVAFGYFLAAPVIANADAAPEELVEIKVQCLQNIESQQVKVTSRTADVYVNLGTDNAAGFYFEPRAGSDTVATVRRGEVLDIWENFSDSGWYLILIGDGNGWIKARDVEVVGKSYFFPADSPYVRNVIRRFAWGDTDTSLGGTIGEMGSLESPAGIATDNNGVLYILDFVNHKIKMFSYSGEYLTSFTCGRAVGFCVTPNYIFTCDLDTVDKFDHDGNRVAHYEMTNSSREPSYYAMGIDYDGRLYFTQSGRETTCIELGKDTFSYALPVRGTNSSNCSRNYYIPESSKQVEIRSLNASPVTVDFSNTEYYVADVIGDDGGDICYFLLSRASDGETRKWYSCRYNLVSHQQRIDEVMVNIGTVFNSLFDAAVDTKGNLFQLWLYEDGALLVKPN